MKWTQRQSVYVGECLSFTCLEIRCVDSLSVNEIIIQRTDNAITTYCVESRLHRLVLRNANKYNYANISGDLSLQ